MLCICVFFVLCVAIINCDVPCAARHVRGESVVCVCNSTYCDTVTADVPSSGTYIAYTSTESGLRFSKTTGILKKFDYFSTCCSVTLELDVNTQYQTIEGFGGAVTDSAGINWKSLSEPTQKHLINSYFSSTGIEYNMLRVPIGGSDFSTHAYAYNELSENDVELNNFSLSIEDYHYKLPLIKQAKEVSTSPIHIIATAWSPPSWMKSNHAYVGLSYLIPEYYQTFANYHYKFLEAYKKHGISIWAVTTNNEPMSGTLPGVINSLGWTAKNMGKWIVENLGPTIRNSTFKDVKIIIAEEQRMFLPYMVNAMIMSNPKTLEYIDGIGVHYYTNMIIPASILSEINKQYPHIFIIASEACEGGFKWQARPVVFGSWWRAQNYIKDIIEDLNNNLIGWLDWNICLNEQGGPNWTHNYADSPILINAERDEFYKQPMFYAMGHFSKFIPRNSKRIKVVQKKFFLEQAVENVAFLTPRNTIVVVLHNDGHPKTVRIKFGNKQIVEQMERGSITTIEFPNAAS